MLGFSGSIIFYVQAAAFVLSAYLIENQMFGFTYATGFEKFSIVLNVLIGAAQSVGTKKKPNLVILLFLK
jgi:hypothetical protein